MKLKDIMISKLAGEYTYKVADNYYQIHYNKGYLIVYETDVVILDSPCMWSVVVHTDTFKQAKAELTKYINREWKSL